MAAIELEFDSRGNYKQDLAFERWADNYTTEIVYGGAKGGGKSFLGCSIIFSMALMYPGTHWFIARKTLQDLRKHTRPSIEEVVHDKDKGWGLPKTIMRYHGQEATYYLQNGSKVYFLECKPMPSDPTYKKLGSIQMTGGWIEEAGEIEEEAKKALIACIGRWKNDKYNLPGKLLMTCNPTKGWLYRDYYKPWTKGEDDPKGLKYWQCFIQALPYDNKSTPGYVEHLEKTLTGSARKRLLEGNWDFDDDPSVLIDYDRILDLFEPEEEYAPLPAGLKCMTSDIARLGGAKVVSIKWNGFVGYVKSWDRAKLNVTLERLNKMRMGRELQIPERLNWPIPRDKVLVDGDGIGASIMDFGGFPGFRNNGRPLPSKDRGNKRDSHGKLIVENFDNLKSQCAFYIADIIQEGKMKLICENKEDEALIIDELGQLKQKAIGTDMKKGIVPKEEVWKTLDRSPDFSDTIIMRAYFELKGTKMKVKHRDGNDVKTQEYYGEKRRYEKEY